MRYAISLLCVFLLLSVASCAMLDWFFGPSVAPGTVPPGDGPTPADIASGAAGAIGGPVGVIVSQVIAAANLLWTAYRSAPAVQAKRHRKYSAAVVKA